MRGTRVYVCNVRKIPLVNDHYSSIECESSHVWIKRVIKSKARGYTLCMVPSRHLCCMLYTIEYSALKQYDASAVFCEIQPLILSALQPQELQPQELQMLNNQPNDHLNCIFDYLTPNEIYIMSMVCKRFQHHAMRQIKKRTPEFIQAEYTALTTVIKKLAMWFQIPEYSHTRIMDDLREKYLVEWTPVESSCTTLHGSNLAAYTGVRSALIRSDRFYNVPSSIVELKVITHANPSISIEPILSNLQVLRVECKEFNCMQHLRSPLRELYVRAVVCDTTHMSIPSTLRVFQVNCIVKICTLQRLIQHVSRVHVVMDMDVHANTSTLSVDNLFTTYAKDTRLVVQTRDIQHIWSTSCTGRLRFC